jgi:hypothetical protein
MGKRIDSLAWCLREQIQAMPASRHGSRKKSDSKPPILVPYDLIKRTEKEKTKGVVRIAYQIPESAGMACGRSLEASFILANLALFGMATISAPDFESEASKKGGRHKEVILCTTIRHHRYNLESAESTYMKDCNGLVVHQRERLLRLILPASRAME